MADGEHTVGRRQLLVGGLSIGTALVIVPSVADTASADTVAEGEDQRVWGTVAQGGPADQAIHMMIGDEVTTVAPGGFPAGWELAVGDLMVVDLTNLVVWPHVEPRPDGSFWTVNRVDPQSSQLFLVGQSNVKTA